MNSRLTHNWVVSDLVSLARDQPFSPIKFPASQGHGKPPKPSVTLQSHFAGQLLHYRIRRASLESKGQKKA